MGVMMDTQLAVITPVSYTHLDVYKRQIVARWFLLISGPRVRVPGGAPDIERQIVRFDVLFCYVTPKNRGLHGQCTVSARLVFSWESSAWAGICLLYTSLAAVGVVLLLLFSGVAVLGWLQPSCQQIGRAHV